MAPEATGLNDFSPSDLRAPFVLLNDRLTPGGGGRLYTDPRAVIRCDDPDRLDQAFRDIERGLADGPHAAGLFSYELGYGLEPKLAPMMPRARSDPLVWMGLFEARRTISADALDAYFASLAPPPPISRVRGGLSRDEHIDKVDRILRLIAAGDAYQVNLTFPLSVHYGEDPLRLYAALRSRQPVAHGGVAAFGCATVLSVSPELWVEVVDGIATTRPMKGTSPRRDDPAGDHVARDTLAVDPKQRAENLMIVDLMRNDLGRISTPGSVPVPDLFTVDTYRAFTP